MNTEAQDPKSLQDAIRYFAKSENCLSYIVKRRWPDGVVRCPSCGSDSVRFLATRRLWECKAKHAKRQFSVKVGTIMEDSAIALDKWLTAMWMIANCRNGVSSYKIARTVRVTQKSAWFMLHRIRLAMQESSMTKLGGSGNPIEVDETFIGGKARNMHKGRLLKLNQIRSGFASDDVRIPERYWGKAVVMGLLERGGKVRAAVLPRRKGDIVQQVVRDSLLPGSEVITDDFTGYVGLSDQHVTVSRS